MKIYFAPLEGVTGYIYRRAHWKYYGGADKYFTPFLSPTKNKAMTYRERNDILPSDIGLFLKVKIKASLPDSLFFRH